MLLQKDTLCELGSYILQKRPDVHKIVLPIKLRPPPGKSVNFEDFLLICTVFPHFGPFSGGGQTKFRGQEFHGHPDFSEFWPFLRTSARAPTSEAVRGTIAIKGIPDN